MYTFEASVMVSSLLNLKGGKIGLLFPLPFATLSAIEAEHLVTNNIHILCRLNKLPLNAGIEGSMQLPRLCSTSFARIYGQ